MLATYSTVIDFRLRREVIKCQRQGLEAGWTGLTTRRKARSIPSCGYGELDLIATERDMAGPRILERGGPENFAFVLDSPGTRTASIPRVAHDSTAWVGGLLLLEETAGNLEGGQLHFEVTDLQGLQDAPFSAPGTAIATGSRRFQNGRLEYQDGLPSVRSGTPDPGTAHRFSSSIMVRAMPLRMNGVAPQPIS